MRGFGDDAHVPAQQRGPDSSRRVRGMISLWIYVYGINTADRHNPNDRESSL